MVVMAEPYRVYYRLFAVIQRSQSLLALRMSANASVLLCVHIPEYRTAETMQCGGHLESVLQPTRTLSRRARKCWDQPKPKRRHEKQKNVLDTSLVHAMKEEGRDKTGGGLVPGQSRSTKQLLRGRQAPSHHPSRPGAHGCYRISLSLHASLCLLCAYACDVDAPMARASSKAGSHPSCHNPSKNACHAARCALVLR